MRGMRRGKGTPVKTGNKPKGPACNLGRFIPDSMDVEEVKADGFNSHGILVVTVADPRLSWIERQIIEQIGKRLYGRR